MSIKNVSFVAIGLILGLGSHALRSGPASAAMMSLNPSKDNTLYEPQTATGLVSNGQGIYLYSGVTGTNTDPDNLRRRSLLHFDVAGNLPSGSTITNATLTLRVSREPIVASASNSSLHRVTTDWGEGASVAPGNGGAGTTPETGDATWDHTFFSSTSWSSSGGDFSVSASATQSVDDAGTFPSWTSATVISDVQDMLDNPSNNFGWVLIIDEAGTLNARRFDSREATTSANRPSLTIEFTAPGGTPTATPTATPTTGPGGVDNFVAYKVKAPKEDVGGVPIPNKNQLPSPWVVTVNDTHIDDIDPLNDDDPENFEVKKVKSLLNPAIINTDLTPLDPALHYLRYQMKLAKQGINGGSSPAKAVKHKKRRWQLQNEFGTINVISKKASAVLIPAAKSLASPPANPGDNNHFICYQVTASKETSDQTPGGKFRKDLQAYFADQFIDCLNDASGNPSFDGTPVQNRCLFDLKKVKELCNPMDKNSVLPPRETLAFISGSNATTTTSLLCYQAKRASKFTNSDAATLVGVTVGSKIDPKQSKHLKRRVKDGNPVYTAPGNLFPRPNLLDTNKEELACIPTDVLGVSLVP